jgi:integrase
MAIKKLDSGRWQIDFYDQEGTRTRASFDTQKAAKLALGSIASRVHSREYIPPTKIPTFRAEAEDWLAVDKVGRRQGTLGFWRSHLDRHLFPAIGNLRLDQISVHVLEKLRADLQPKLSAASAQAVVQTCGAVLKWAVKHDRLRKNPVDKVSPVFVGSKELKPGYDDDGDSESAAAVDPDKVLSPAEIRVLLNHAAPGYYRTLILTAFLTGARGGELFALRWGDVELGSVDSAGKVTGKGTIKVGRSLSWARAKKALGVKMKPLIYEPKTKAGIRVIKIQPQLVKALKEWRLQCPKGDGDLVFPDTDGQPMHRANALRRGVRPALRRAKLRNVTLHSLRHSCASAMIAAGAPITECQHQLGHANPGVTLKVYSHWFKDTESGAIDAIAGALFAGKENLGHQMDTSTEADRVSA